jgi:peptide chain release factor subunit 1
VVCRDVITDEGKQRKLNIDFEPFKPINTSLYLCDNKFHTEALNELLEDDARFGFVVMDGNGCLFGTLTGNTRDVIHKFSVDLPKKHGRGGQSALRFSRLRDEKRHNYVRRVAEQMSNLFITNSKPNVAGLVLAGSAEFKNDLAKSDLFDQRLRPLILKIVDVSYGDFNGFNQAIELAADVLGNVRFIHEKQILEKFFEDISKEGGKTCYGYIETLKSLEAGAVETLIVYEDLPMTRWKLVDPAGVDHIVYTKDSSEQPSLESTNPGEKLTVVDSMALTEWFTDNYTRYGATLEFVSDRSQEGSQFVKGFGGVGALLRFQLDVSTLEYEEDDDEDYYDD